MSNLPDEQRSRPATVVAAIVLMAVQAAVTALVGLWLVGSEAPCRREWLGDTIADRRAVIGLAALVVVAVLVVFIVFVAQLRPWARTAAMVTEAFIGVLQLLSFRARPGGAVVAVAVAASVVALLALSDSGTFRSDAHREASSPPPTVDGGVRPGSSS